MNKVFASGQAIREASLTVLRPTVHGSKRAGRKNDLYADSPQAAGYGTRGKIIFFPFSHDLCFYITFLLCLSFFPPQKTLRPFEMRQAQKNIVERERNTRRGFLPKSFVKIKNRKAVNVYSSFGKGHFLPSVVMEHSVTEVRNAGYDSQEETSLAVTSTS